jgi:peptidoglycan/xylan/chitin deacetylase (PgdA/CDA1 family)
LTQYHSRIARAIYKRLAGASSYDARAGHYSACNDDFSGPRIDGIRERKIYLTFDDGPHPINTSKLLDELKQTGVRATFFVIGKNLETPRGKELMQRAAAEGHQIGNHTYSHPHLTELSQNQIREEILKTESLIGGASKRVKLFRPPHGEHNALVDQVAQELGYTLVLWNVDTRDWRPEWEGRWVEHAMAQIMMRELSIVVAHDRLTTTVAEVGSLIAKIRKLGQDQ